MGKKARPPLKEKREAGYSPKTVPEQEHLNVEIVDGVTAVKERKLCSHFEKGFDANQLSEKIRSLDSLRCGDCREGVGGRKGAKGRAKLAKKGSGSVDSKSESKAIWPVEGLDYQQLLRAMQFVIPSRAVILWSSNGKIPQLQWCFPCSKLIPVVKTEGNGEKKDSVSEVVKMIKAQSFEQSSVDAMDVWIGRGSILSELNAEGNGATSLEGRSGHVVRGLVNLGNTCFFNSVMQNLLSMNKLRDYFLNEEASLGPLSIALKKLFTDLKDEASLRKAINPKSFFGSVCSNAPQFRGYQQQDSHELLRCLLDGLSNEELIVRKRKNASEEDDIPPKHGPMFVDSAFGGQISSTVCCVECGHSSTMHEPFLDLSLPVPMKKPPIKKVQPVSRAKKTKLPPKRGGKVQPKVKKNMVLVPAQNISNPSVHSESSCQTQSSSDNTLAPDSNVSSTVVSASGIASQNLMAGVESDSKQAVDTAMKQTASSFEDFWMDYVGTETSSDEHDLTSENIDLEAGQQCGDKFVIPNDGLMEACQGPSIDREPNQKPDSSSINPWEEEVPLQVQSSEVLLLPYREEGFTDGEIMKGEAESSSSFVGCEQDEAGFDGIGDLFNEPEVSTAPVAGPSLPNEVAGPVFIAGVSSESDPDEVDDTDSPVSIESCLSHFVKPELLSNDNAWECENCSKILGQQMLDAKKKQAKISSNFFIKWRMEMVTLTTSSAPHLKSLFQAKIPQIKTFIQAEIVQTEMELVDETSDTGYTMAKDEQIDSNFSGNCESDVNEDEDKTSKHVNVKRDATKRVLIDKAPPILTIHLKRFSQDARGRLCKLNGHVTFRDVLDVGPYMDPRCVDTESYVYRLLGVVEHLGTMRGGHYIAYVRGDKRNQGKGDEEHGGSVWYYASDAHVREVSLEEVLRCDAYLLFYEKV
ncbi:hypothetical protein OIU76_028495 [Salix suchowensis]|nr:hypothetical protein OIU76_028495 [Salix suchowensis]